MFILVIILLSHYLLVNNHTDDVLMQWRSVL